MITFLLWLLFWSVVAWGLFGAVIWLGLRIYRMGKESGERHYRLTTYVVVRINGRIHQQHCIEMHRTLRKLEGYDDKESEIVLDFEGVALHRRDHWGGVMLPPSDR